jgi:hypothetical protein
MGSVKVEHSTNYFFRVALFVLKVLQWLDPSMGTTHVAAKCSCISGILSIHRHNKIVCTSNVPDMALYTMCMESRVWNALRSKLTLNQIH